jgi:Cu/Ag efflux protein CusF
MQGHYQHFSVLFALVIVFAALACERTERPDNTKVAAPAPKATATVNSEIYHSKGTVRGTNPKFPSVEIEHEDIPGLMPPMTMEFYVRDVSMLSGLKAGDKVEFTIVNGVGGLKISEIKKL